ncbi:hypothetical protein [Brucella sp.]|uniref:hypothetical protein n=1 Tax=Brucella sp. TaxID=52132 RepID=UPI0028AF4603|nr:hypothetical protein [Brucella sp.]
MKYEVIRQHQGDKFYLPGDERDASENDVAHLVKSGVLKAKAEGKPKNKAEGASDKNKGE